MTLAGYIAVAIAALSILICLTIGWIEHNKAVAARKEADAANDALRSVRALLKFQRNLRSEAGKRAHTTAIHRQFQRDPLIKAGRA